LITEAERHRRTDRQTTLLWHNCALRRLASRGKKTNS